MSATLPDALDLERVKKEHVEHCASDNGPSAPANNTNGFHQGEANLLHNILANKFAAMPNHSPAAKHEKIRLIIEDTISEDSRASVQEIFSQVEKLKLEERLLLYLKLPMSLTNPGGTMDPLRQPLNPLGNRYEIYQTIMWIKTHLEEDPDVSLPKQEVYEEYDLFCKRNFMKPLSTADFGKVMKQVYPRVRPRRLGTRGNSRYCYAGMRKRIKLNHQTLPAISAPADDNEMIGAASTLVCELAEDLFETEFPTLSSLGRYLVENLYVDTRSLAAVCMMCNSNESKFSVSKETSPVLSAGKNPGKLREAQLQLQRKLQQREHIRDQKHRNVETVLQNSNKDKTVDNKSSAAKGGRRSKMQNQSPQGTNDQQHVKVTAASKKGQVSPAPCVGRQKKWTKGSSQSSSASPQSNCDNSSTVLQPSCNAESSACAIAPRPKSARKRSVAQRSPSGPSPEKQHKLAAEQAEKKTAPKVTSKSPRAKNAKTSLQAAKSCDNADKSDHAKTNGFDGKRALLSKDQLRLLHEGSNDKLCTIDPESLNDYLNGGNNSQEPEEELLQYFQQSNSSSSDIETSVQFDPDSSSRSDKVTQLRVILQGSYEDVADQTPDSVLSSSIDSVVVETKQEAVQKHEIILPTLVSEPGGQAQRRRVSFESNVMEHSNTVPQSPNTRRRIFNFTPISPSPHSPINGRVSKSNSANASPFVSPRNTPVPRSRSSIQAGGGCKSRGVPKTLSRSISCSVPYTGKAIDTFIVPTSGPDVFTKQLVVTTTTKSSEVQVGGHSVSVQPKSDTQEVQCTPFLSFDLAPQKQLLINYPVQENLQEIKNTHQRSQPTDMEIRELLHGAKPLSEEQLCRSQSVPVNRMFGTESSTPALPSFFSPFPSQVFNQLSGSSITPTPVPSEFNDFGSIETPAEYLLEDVDANFMTDDQLLISDKEMSSENISNILNILDEPDMISEGVADDSDEMLLNTMHLGNNDVVLGTSCAPVAKMNHSRSYPNTPLPLPATSSSSSSSSFVVAFADENNASRSHPSTPLHNLRQRETYVESNEPMLSSPTLNTLNVHESGAIGANSGAFCTVTDLLETNIFSEPDAQNGDLDPLGQFDELQDVDSLAPLFNEVVEPNR